MFINSTERRALKTPYGLLNPPRNLYYLNEAKTARLLDSEAAPLVVCCHN